MEKPELSASNSRSTAVMHSEPIDSGDPILRRSQLDMSVIVAETWPLSISS